MSNKTPKQTTNEVSELYVAFRSVDNREDIITLAETDRLNNRIVQFPLMTSNPKMLPWMKKVIQEMADNTGQSIKLVKYSNREIVAEVEQRLVKPV